MHFFCPPGWHFSPTNPFCTFFPVRKPRRGGGHVCFSKPGLYWKPLASSKCCFAQFLVCKHAVKQLMSVKPLWASAPRGDERGRSGISTTVSCSSPAALGSPCSGGSPISHHSWRRDFFKVRSDLLWREERLLSKRHFLWCFRHGLV